MDGVNKISAEDAAKIAGSVNTGAKTIQWRNKRVTVRPILPLSEMAQTVCDIIESCINKDERYFMPELIDFATRYHVVVRYAMVEMPDDIELQNTILYATDLYDTVKNLINTAQFQSITESVEMCAYGLLRQSG